MSASAEDAALDTLKRYRRGTHRVLPPQETLDRISPVVPTVGITRLADITRLDRVGIPTYQAIRPNARSVAVSQGKGLSGEAAKVSALMESIEVWHAERVPPPVRSATVAELAEDLGYDVFALRHFERSLLNSAMRLDWIPAQRMDGTGETLVPRDYVSVDYRIRRKWSPPVFATSSNGLASGNTLEEAALHGLCEVVERDATKRLQASPPSERTAVELDSVTAPDAADVLARLRRLRIRVDVVDCRGPTRIPCFEVMIAAEDHPWPFYGAGCHNDPGVALCRALCEAAQVRLAVISGVRDDLPISFGDLSAAPPRVPAPEALAAGVNRFATVDSLASDDVGRDLDEVVARVRAQTGASPLLVDLTRPDVGLPVVKVIAPGMVVAPPARPG